MGRRFGKSTYEVDRLIHPALQGYPVGWFAPTYQMMAEVWRDFARLCRPIAARTNASEHRMELVTGGVVEFWSLDNPDAGRSRKYKRVAIDEAGLVPNLLDIFHQAIRPTLADYAGEADLCGTPKGLNDFYTLWTWGADAARPDWASFQAPTHANPFIPPAELADLQRDLPERVYQQEILAQFLDTGAGVFRRVRAAATAVPQDRAVADHEYVFGIDWAREADWTVIAVVDLTLGALVHVDRFQGIEYTQQVGRVQALAARFAPKAIFAEANSIGGPLLETLQRLLRHVRGLTTTNATKAAWVDDLALAFEREALTLIDDATVIGELLAYESTKLPSGLIRYSAPVGQHDDCVMALLLAWQATLYPRQAKVHQGSFR